MATWYCDGSASAGGDGSAGDPFAMLNFELIPNLQDGDTVNLAGTFREGEISLVGFSNVRFQQWAGQPAWKVRGDHLAGASGWTPGPNNSYSKVVPMGSAGVSAVQQNWDAKIDSGGRHYGHLKKDTLANVQAGTARTWFADSVTGTLYIRLGSGGAGTVDDPNSGASGTIGYCDAQVQGISCQGCTGIVIDGVEVALFCDPASGFGYNVLFGDSAGCTLSNFVLWDSGYHGFGATGSCSGHRVTNGVIHGGNSTPAGSGTSVVFYSGSGTVSDCVASGLDIYPYTALGDTIAGDGLAQVNDTTISFNGCFTHSGVSTTSVVDVLFTGCTVTFHGTSINTCNGDNAFACDDTTQPATVGDRDDWTKYNVRVVGCTIVGGFQNLSASSIAFYRCRLAMTRVKHLTTASTGNVGCLDRAVPADHTMLLTACEVVGKLGGGPLDNRIFRVTARGRLVLINCSVYSDLDASDSTHFEVLIAWSGAATLGVRARGCVFAFGNGTSLFHMLNNGAPASSALHDFVDCAYYSVRQTNVGYTSPAAWDTWAEWHAAIDTTGFELGANPYSDTSGSSLALTPTAKASKKIISPATALGFNGLPYDGSYGAHQYGASGGGGSGHATRIGIGIGI